MATNLGGPQTPNGQAIAARNATTHGLFARDVVLTELGEDPAAFDALLEQLLAQIPPRHLLERHYLEQIAAASWRLRRLHRWQAQIYEDDTLTEDERLDKLDKVLRHETALSRQIDRSVRMMNRDLAWLFQSRARDDALYFRNVTDVECRQDADLAIDVQQRVWKQARSASPDAALDYDRLDNTHAAPAESQNCQNEPLASTPDLPLRGDPAKQGREVPSVPPPLLNREGSPTAEVGSAPTITKTAKTNPHPCNRHLASANATGLSPIPMAERWRSRRGGLPCRKRRGAMTPINSPRKVFLGFLRLTGFAGRFGMQFA